MSDIFPTVNHHALICFTTIQDIITYLELQLRPKGRMLWHAHQGLKYHSEAAFMLSHLHLP